MNMKSRSWLVTLAWLLALTLAGCDGKASGSSNPDGPKWQIDYSGDLSGRIEGKSLVIVRTGPPKHLNFAVKTIGNNPGLTATLSVHEDKPFGFLSRVTLENGTKCTPVDRSDVNVLDTSKETFHATINGKLKCGEAEDQIIDFEAVIQER
jgi:hypothetical protein